MTGFAQTLETFAESAGLENETILSDLETRIDRFFLKRAGIPNRLRELESEWSIERVLESVSAGMILAGAGLGLASNKRFLSLSAMFAAFLFQHAIVGWCPQINVLRKLGFRTAREIECERVALKALRGDFDNDRMADVTARALIRAADPGLFH